MTDRAAGRRPDQFSNKGTAYTHEERAQLGVEGLLPPRVETLEEQSARAIGNVRSKTAALEKYVYLASLQDENATLFYRVLLDHLAELLPFVYTPTVGEACIEWSRIYTRPRGIYVSARHRGRIARLLRNWPAREIGVIVVTDGGRILGLGDLGANGMGIPIGKLALYTACAGVRPELCLPVTLDVGTNNQILRNDPFYIGERTARMTGEPWDALLEEFVTATQAVFPGAIVQFEDFNTVCAFGLLARYHDRLCCFNDDVQGTGAMGLAGLYAAGRITQRKLTEQRILFVGAGEACLGIGTVVAAAMKREGLSASEAKARCLFFDSRGLVVTGRADLSAQKRPFAHERAGETDLCSVIESYAPTALIGASGKGSLFTQPVLAAMARATERPIVFALSNPTANAECTAEQAYRYTSGRAVFASGSPSPAVKLAGRIYTPGQGNNSYVFPGMGLGLLVSGAKRVTDEMLLAAAQALAGQVFETDLETGRVYPAAERMREVAANVAAAVARVAHDEGNATRAKPVDFLDATRSAMYEPLYA